MLIPAQMNLGLVYEIGVAVSNWNRKLSARASESLANVAGCSLVPEPQICPRATRYHGRERSSRAFAQRRNRSRILIAQDPRLGEDVAGSGSRRPSPTRDGQRPRQHGCEIVCRVRP